MTLGRGDDCDFKIDDSVPGARAISRHHAHVEQRGARWVVIDGSPDGQRSTNGVYVNNKRTFENYLTDNVEIKFAGVAFRFHLQHAVPNPAQGVSQ